MQHVVTIRHSLKLAGQLAAILIAAFAVVCVLFLLIAYEESQHFPVKRLLSMVLLTGGVFPAVVAEFKPSWRRWQFWLTVAGLFALHILACIVVWRADVEWRAITYAAIALAEIFVLWASLDICGFRRPAATTKTERHR